MKPFEYALKEYGVWEWIGSAANPAVLKYFKETGFEWVHDDETAWCAAFVNWCLKKAGRQYTNSLRARSFLDYGNSAMDPKLGDIVVLWRIYPSSPYGHVGFFISRDENYIYILGGNQGNQVNITKYPRTQLLDYREIA